MKNLFLLLFALLLCIPEFAQTKSPLVQPIWTFFDSSGAPCVGCSLYTYAAGTTNALATYTDASGTSQNTNPIILNTSGSAQIWVGTSALKLVLKDTGGTTIWTADNITGAGGSGSPCGPASTIQISNSTLTGFSCDSLITINTSLHTINVGGPLPTMHFTLGNLGTIVTPWILDTTSPSTARSSLGLGTFATQSAPTGGTQCLHADASGNVTGTSADCAGPAITQLTGDGTAGPGSGSQPFTLATVNASPGACGDSSHVCQITTNAKGLVTAQTAVALAGQISAGHLGSASCSTGSSSYSTCTSVVSISPAFGDTNYYPVCSGRTPSDGRAAIIGCTPTSANTVTITVVTEGSVSVSYADLYVIAYHP